MLTINLLPEGRQLGRRRQIQNRYYHRHQEEVAAYRRGRKDVHAQYMREYRWEKDYGITPAQYAEALSRQGGHCAVCSRTELHVDHDHETGEFRGLLCGNHNRALGLAHDDPAVLRALADYLEKR